MALSRLGCIALLLFTSSVRAQLAPPSADAYYRESMMRELCNGGQAARHPGLDELRTQLLGYYRSKLAKADAAQAPQYQASIGQLDADQVPAHVRQKMSEVWAQATPAQNSGQCALVDVAIERQIVSGLMAKMKEDQLPTYRAGLLDRLHAFLTMERAVLLRLAEQERQQAKARGQQR